MPGVLGPSGTVYGDRFDIDGVVEQTVNPQLPIARLVFPPLEVDMSIGQRQLIGMKNYANEPGNSSRQGDNPHYPSVDVLRDQQTYETFAYGEQFEISDRKRANMKNATAFEVAGVNVLSMRQDMREEVAASALLMNDTTWGTADVNAMDASVAWTSDSAKQKADMEKALKLLALQGGNPLAAEIAMNYVMFLRLLNAENLLNDRRYVNTPSLMVTDQNKATIAGQLGVNKVFVGAMRKNTKAQGIDPVLDWVWPSTRVSVGNFSCSPNDPVANVVGRTYYNANTKGLGRTKTLRHPLDESDIYTYGREATAQVDNANLAILIDVTATP